MVKEEGVHVKDIITPNWDAKMSGHLGFCMMKLCYEIIFKHPWLVRSLHVAAFWPANNQIKANWMQSASLLSHTNTSQQTEPSKIHQCDNEYSHEASEDVLMGFSRAGFASEWEALSVSSGVEISWFLINLSPAGISVSREWWCYVVSPRAFLPQDEKEDSTAYFPSETDCKMGVLWFVFYIIS